MATQVKRPARSRAKGPPGHKSAAREHRRSHAAPTPARQRLVESAAQLVERDGYDALRVGRIWRAAGLSHETFYTHFADKRAVVCASEDERLAGIEALLSDAEGDGCEWARQLSHALHQMLCELYDSAHTPRGRLLAAMLELAATQGYRSVTQAALCRAAHVSTVDLPRHFDSLADCFSAALCVRISQLAAQLEQADAGAGEVDPIAATRRAIAALAELLAQDPAAARILLAEAGALTEPPEDNDKRAWAGSLRELVERLLEPVDAPSPTVRRICAGGAVEVLRSVYLRDGAEGLAGAGEEIAAAVLAPLVGAGSAAGGCRSSVA